MRHTARAVLTNSQGHCFLALHNHYLPENIGKWGTVGGILDDSDADISACLARELSEEFCSVSADTFKISEKLVEVTRGSTVHHFFRVWTNEVSLTIAQPQEILEAGFLTLDEVEKLKSKGKLYFDVEDELYRQVLNQA